MIKVKTIAFLLIILTMLYHPFILADNPVYKLKAGFIEKFSRFITWPHESGIHDTSKPFIITVLGDNPFEGELQKMFIIDKIKIRHKNVEIKYINDPAEIGECQILFVPECENEILMNILSTVRDKPILLISDTPGYAEKGTHINFYINEDGGLHFEINKHRGTESKVKISSKLLKIAKIVDSD